MADDLLTSGIELAGKDQESLKRMTELESKKTVAEAEYRRLLEAAGQRRASEKKPASAMAESTKGAVPRTGRALPLLPAMRLKVTPIKPKPNGP